jgi:hypothetical protein
MRLAAAFVLAIALLSISTTAGAEPMPAPAPPRPPRIKLDRDGILAHDYTPRGNETRQVIVVNLAKEKALWRALQDIRLLANAALAEGNIFIAWDFVDIALYRFEKLVGPAVDRFSTGRDLLEAHAYLTLALHEPEEARRLCVAHASEPMVPLARRTCGVVLGRAAP